MQPSHKGFLNEAQRSEYLNDAAYDWGCDWVVRNLPRVRALVPETKIDADGFVIEGEDRSRLFALRQIAARQDASMYGLSGPVVGFIDVAIVEESMRERKFSIEGNGIKWAVAVFVRPTIPHIGSFLREIERCRHGHIKDNRASVVGGYHEDYVSPKNLTIVIITKGVEHRDTITSQGFIFFSCPEAFNKPSTSAPSQSVLMKR